MRTLIIGDSHLKISILDQARSYIDQLLVLIREGKYEYVILLGDQMDTFAVVRSEILALWTKFFLEAGKHTKIIALVGNHDLSGAHGGTNPMEPFKQYPNVTVVDQTYCGPNYSGLSVQLDRTRDSVVFLPFIRDKAEFEMRARQVPAGSILVCHQSFNGAKFESGTYDPHGADPACVAHLAAVISGHIHLRQLFLNIWYPGAPFQHSFGDAGAPKFVYEVDLQPGGYNILKEISLKLPTFEVVKAETIPELITAVDALSINPNGNYKVIAKGTPSEIQAFWQDSSVRRLKERSRRVVDGLTSFRPEAKLIQLNGKTRSEKMNEFILSKQWRSPSDQLARLAEKFLTQ